jgi:transmembrane sensor
VFELVAGEQAIIGQRVPEAHVKQVDPNKVIGWTERRLYFDDTPLTEVVSEFARYSPHVIHIADDALAGRRISGTFDSSDPAVLVDFLAHFGGVPIQQTADGWIVGPVSLSAHRPK